MNLANKLKEGRIKMGYSQEKVEKLTGIKERTISNYENGVSRPDVDNLKKLIDLYDLDPDALFEIKPKQWNKVPLYGKIPAGDACMVAEDIEDYIYAEVDNADDYFFLEVKGNSMIGINIHPGYRVLVRRQQDVENGEIAIVKINSEEATLKRVKKENGEVRLIAENPQYPTQIVKHEDACILGKVIRVEFEPK